MAPVPNAQVPGLRVLVAAGREKEEADTSPTQPTALGAPFWRVLTPLHMVHSGVRVSHPRRGPLSRVLRPAPPRVPPTSGLRAHATGSARETPEERAEGRLPQTPHPPPPGAALHPPRPLGPRPARLHPRPSRRPLPATRARGNRAAGPAPAHPQLSPGAPHWACSVAWAGWGCEATARALEPGGENEEGGSGAGEEGAAGRGGAVGPGAGDAQGPAVGGRVGVAPWACRGAKAETPALG
ncbi:hypothetical protein P7K49_009349 [Saguinus oedipus]|uniref:Uncharacterized protein n=1 Tax=Saguinus oedipus TaxID=9490 RepID=A0ABQ9VJP4_SAGOE|nr:hypothetical protein P7K49_009349 [Saguinus oedipus]